MKTTTSKRTSKKTAPKYAPTAWQWDAENISDATAAPGFKNQIQFWSAGGSMSIVTVARAKELVRMRAAFVGAPNYICQVSDRIDGCNAA